MFNVYLFMKKKIVRYTSDIDTGSTESQITLFSSRIQHITKHLKNHKKDFNSQKSLLSLVGKRRKLLTYIKNRNIGIYRNITSKLEIRK